MNNLGILIFALFVSTNVFSQEISNKSELEQYAKKTELVVESGNKCYKSKPASKNHCSKFVNYIKSDFNSESRAFSKNLDKYMGLDFDLTMQVTNSYILIAEFVFENAKHNR